MTTSAPLDRYEYRDGFGVVRYVVARWPNKRFSFEGDASERFPYHLDRLIEAAVAGGEAFVTEGEKDCDRMMRELQAVSWANIVATTSAGGAPWTWPDDWCEYFRGLEAVYVLADNDEPGRRAAIARARVIARVVPRVTVLSMLPGIGEHGDVSDFLDNGGTLEDVYRYAAGAPEVSAIESDTYDVRQLGTLEREPIEWLWPGWLPRGKLVVLDGDPALGKSTLALDIAARITNGGAMPDGHAPQQGRRNVLILTAEDGITDTVLPRFLEAGGDPRHAYVLVSVTDKGDQRPVVLPTDLHTVELVARTTNAVMIIVDVLAAYLADSVNSHNDASMRSVLMRLAAVGERTRAAIVTLRHLNKAPTTNVLYRGGGSIGIIGAARAGWVVAPHPVDNTKRVLAVTKSNLANPPDSLAYSVVRADGWDCARIAWHGLAEYSAEDLMRRVSEASERGEPETARGRAMTWLLELLQDGHHGASWIKLQAEDAGISYATLRRAKDDLGVLDRIVFTDGRRMSVWYLPGREGPP